MNIIVKVILHIVTVVKHSFRCKYKGNETFCSFKIVVCPKGTYLFNSVFNFPTVIRFKLQYSERFKWSEFNISNPDFKFQSHNALLDENVTFRWTTFCDLLYYLWKYVNKTLWICILYHQEHIYLTCKKSRSFPLNM